MFLTIKSNEKAESEGFVKLGGEAGVTKSSSELIKSKVSVMDVLMSCCAGLPGDLVLRIDRLSC